MRHHANFLVLTFFLIFTPQLAKKVQAVDSRSNREAVVSPRAKKFYKSDGVRKYLSLNGNYTSDYNSKNYKLNSRYLYQSQNFIHEINFENENYYSDVGSGSTRSYDVKKSELYDILISSKARILNSKNYGVFFHRTMYDDLSKYYYDLHTAAGIGRMFFKERVELDISIGYHDIKTYGYEVDIIPSVRTNFKITKNLTLTQRGYWFIDHESTDSELKSSIVYRLNNKLSVEIRHSFEKRRYEEDDKNIVTNQVSRSLTFGLIFDLN
jgi:hypothetical protein